MDKRENALREALTKNAEETDRWNKYQHENKTAIENLERFSKHLTVDVMVPVGRKAFMPGQLVHTNEVLVGHYQGYFSKCSAHKAKEICEHRIKMAEEQLKKLITEEELWQNKLEKPYVEGVLPSGEQQDIIEPYDEKVEEQWRAKHKERVRQFKQAEREERNRIALESKQICEKEKTNEEILAILEDAECMEELENELDSIEIDEINDDTIKKLMSGEMKLPEKKRIAHNDVETIQESSNEQLKLQGVVKFAELNTKIDNTLLTNNNVRPNPELVSAAFNNYDIDVEDIDSDTEQLPEVQIIKEQATYLTKEDQIGFYDYQIQIIKQKLLAVPLRDQDGINEKIRLHQVLEELEELLEIVEETVGSEILAKEEKQLEEQDEANANNSKISGDNTLKKSKRLISFASEDQTIEFLKNDTVKEMLSKRDVITLNEPHKSNSMSAVHEEEKPTIVDRKQSILERVEQNRKYVEEHQSESDFDIVNKILESQLERENTLHITFKHSEQNTKDQENIDSHESIQTSDEISSDIPCTPKDFYDMYIKLLRQQESNTPVSTTIYLNGYDGEEDVKVPILSEAKREQAFVDPRLEFSKTRKESKSILRNRDAVKNEKRAEMNSKEKSINKNKKQKSLKSKEEEDGFMTIYEKVVNDVVEKPLIEPEPLPNCKFIDAHARKKRVSRFKQIRSNV